MTYTKRYSMIATFYKTGGVLVVVIVNLTLLKWMVSQQTRSLDGSVLL